MGAAGVRRGLPVGAILVAVLLSGCTDLGQTAKEATTVPQEQKDAVAVELALSAILADALEALDAALSSPALPNATSARATVGGHFGSSVVYTWNGTADRGAGTMLISGAGIVAVTYGLGFSRKPGEQYHATLNGTTPAGTTLAIDLGLNRTDNRTFAIVSGKADSPTTTFEFSGNAYTDGPKRVSQWGWKVADVRSKATVTLVVTFAEGAFRGGLTVTGKLAKPLGAAGVGNDGIVAVTFTDKATVRVPVFPDPTVVRYG